jgi:large subunit ribosomal protein L35
MQQIRTRITCSKNSGKEKSVKTAMERYFRLGQRIWVRSQPAYHRRLYAKPVEKRFSLQQAVLVGRAESRTLERMSGRYYKRLKVENFVDAPFIYYHPYINKIKQMVYTQNRGNNKFYP